MGERYRIIPERSRVLAQARSSLHPIRSEATGLEGYVELELDGDRLKLDAPVTGHVELAVQQLKTGNALYDRELERRLEVRRYPHLRGEVLAVLAAEPGNRYRVRGELTLHGRTRPLDGEVTIRVVDGGRRLEIEGQRVFDLRDFGLDPPRLLMLRVYPDVTIRGSVVAERE